MESITAKSSSHDLPRGESNNEILAQNKQSWDAMADTWFGSTALPEYGCLIPDEEALHLFPELAGKRVLDIGCGSGHSLKWCGDREAAELWGLDISTKQLENAGRFLAGNGYEAKLVNTPMEADSGLPTGYFDVVYSIYALGWTVDLPKTFANIASCLKPGGTLIFSWDHPLMHCVSPEDGRYLFDGCYLGEERYSYIQRGNPVTVHNHNMAGWINALADAGFAIVRLVEETKRETMERETAFSSDYYAASKAKLFPLSFVMKAVKL